MRPDLPVALIRWATTGRQETLVGTLENIAQRVAETGFEAPAVAVFGEVVSLRDELNWFEGRPAFRQTHRGYADANAGRRLERATRAIWAPT